MYYLDSPTNFNNYEEEKNNHIFILNSNNDEKINNFLLAYVNYKINNIEGYDYEVLRIFDNIDFDVLFETLKSMFPSNMILFKYIDSDTLKEMSDDYMVPENLLKRIVKERKC